MKREIPFHSDLAYLDGWMDERWVKIKTIPFPDDNEEMFRILRDSDIADLRRVMALRVIPIDGVDMYGAYKSYYGIEDAIRTLYRDGCELYMCRGHLRMVYPSGLKFEFHRMEYLKENTFDTLDLVTYLKLARGRNERLACKVRIKWSDKNGDHNY